MSTEQTEHGTVAVRALAAAAASGAATYAVRKALATRNGHDEQGVDQENDAADTNGEPSAEAPESEQDDSEHSDESMAESARPTAEEEPNRSGQSDEDDGGQHEPESSTEEGNEETEEDNVDEGSSNGSSGLASLRQLANPSRLVNLSHLLVPLAGGAADSAGRYVAEHFSDRVQQQVVDRFVDAYEKAS
jgi:hypothetical protein